MLVSDPRFRFHGIYRRSWPLITQLLDRAGLVDAGATAQCLSHLQYFTHWFPHTDLSPCFRPKQLGKFFVHFFFMRFNGLKLSIHTNPERMLLSVLSHILYVALAFMVSVHHNATKTSELIIIRPIIRWSWTHYLSDYLFFLGMVQPVALRGLGLEVCRP